jgi:hypothetical protein
MLPVKAICILFVIVFMIIKVSAAAGIAINSCMFIVCRKKTYLHSGVLFSGMKNKTELEIHVPASCTSNKTVIIAEE